LLGPEYMTRFDQGWVEIPSYR